ncbi:MAG: hydrogenase [Candidatus Thorarchaeota archaeon]|nr:MAG: hydrogenase [Candidatus Thorarchaeota archaeon]
MAQGWCAPRRRPIKESLELLHGKLPPDVLERLVFNHLGKIDPDVVLGPGTGRDAALLRVGNMVLVASTDPITGSIEDVGWLSVHVNANDVAAFGVAPRWFFLSIMLPSGNKASSIGRIMEQVDEAAKSLNVSVAGGHTEVTPSIDRPIVAGFMLGLARQGQYVVPSGARPGDSIVLTKTIGIEGTAIIAAEGAPMLVERVGRKVISEGRSLRSQISVVREGLAAFQSGHVTGMHDPTEGGVAGGVHELCDSSEVGCEIDSDTLPIHPSTEALCQELGINVLELISSGCMLITCDPEHANDVVSAVQSTGVAARVIGTLVSDPAHRVLTSRKGLRRLPRPKTDALWGALRKIEDARNHARGRSRHRSRPPQ